MRITDAPHGLLSIGHWCFEAAVPIHFKRQCIWKTCVHSPQTIWKSEDRTWRSRVYSLKGQSSPGILHEGQHPSYGTRQMPQTSISPSSSTSSEPVSQRHCAIACHRFTVTFIVDDVEESIVVQERVETRYRIFVTNA